MRFNNQHLDEDGYEADRRMHAEKDDREDDDQNCYSCARFNDCETPSEYMFEHCDEWQREK